MPLQEGDEEVKEGKTKKKLTPNKLFTWLPILLAQIKAGNNPYKLKNKIRQKKVANILNILRQEVILLLTIK